MGFANVRLCKRLSSHSQSYDEVSILCKIAFVKSTLRAIPASVYAALAILDLTTAKPSNSCLA